MATKDFDYKTFAQNLAGQAQELVPQDFNDEQKRYVINTLGNFSMMAGQALAEDPNLNFNAEQSTYITQIIAEWSFHKSVDVIRSGIPRQHWDGIMQKIAYTIFEIAKQTFSQGLPSDQILEIIEHQVGKAYSDAIDELKNRGIIDDTLQEFAKSQSNMEKMTQEARIQQEQQVQEQNNIVDQNLPQPAGRTNVTTENKLPAIDSKVLKLATVAMLFKRMNQDKVQTILNKFDQSDTEDVIKYMKLPNLAEKIGPQNALRCLKEIKEQIPKISDFSTTKIVKKIKNFASKYSANELDTILIKERIGVKRLVYTALEDKYYDKIPPKVASIVATYLQNSV